MDFISSLINGRHSTPSEQIKCIKQQTITFQIQINTLPFVLERTIYFCDAVVENKMTVFHYIHQIIHIRKKSTTFHEDLSSSLFRGVVHTAIYAVIMIQLTTLE